MFFKCRFWYHLEELPKKGESKEKKNPKEIIFSEKDYPPYEVFSPGAILVTDTGEDGLIFNGSVWINMSFLYSIFKRIHERRLSCNL